MEMTLTCGLDVKLNTIIKFTENNKKLKKMHLKLVPNKAHNNEMDIDKLTRNFQEKLGSTFLIHRIDFNYFFERYNQ